MKLRQLILQKYPDWKISEAASAEEGLQKVAEATPDLHGATISELGR
jgi:hypothetical protein